MYDPTKIEDACRIKINIEFRNLYGDPDLVLCIKKNTIRWLRHVHRMYQERFPRKIQGEARRIREEEV